MREISKGNIIFYMRKIERLPSVDPVIPVQDLTTESCYKHDQANVGELNSKHYNIHTEINAPKSTEIKIFSSH